ncbi:MAG: glycosyltransferase [Actinomycetota bacterium]|nr:glycosyltransferase [Actinomycetota bacterium]
MNPSVSVIIPIPPGGSASWAIDSLRTVDYPKDKMEILVVEGRQPSRQRNEAAHEARGDVIYFLDDDSVVEPDLFRRVLSFYDDSKIVGVGGPELSPESDSYSQKAFGYVLGSSFGCFNTRYRFAAIGKPREGTEKHFILANFSLRRKVFSEAGGFNESLYPNEENELINRLRRKGYKLIYDPEAIVYKSRRRSYPEFVKQIFNYGRGRMEHTLISPFTANIPYFIPLLFCVYLVTLLFRRDLPFMLPLYLYILLALVSSIALAVKARSPILIFLAPFLYLSEHVSYGLGLLWGLVKRMLGLRRSQTDAVRINVVKDFAEDFEPKERREVKV